jgi:hypothetical protein
MKYKTMAVFLICMLTILSPARALISPDINIVLTKQNPYPVNPGDNVNIEIEIQNNGYADADNIKIEIQPKPPFTLLPGEEKTKTFSRIAARDSVTADYNLHVDRNATTNSYEIEFRIYEIPSNDYTVEKVLLSVEGAPDLIIEEVKTNKEAIEPGEFIELETVFKNIGTGTAHDVDVSLTSNSSYIVPVFSGGNVYIGDIEPEKSKLGLFKLSIDSSAEPATYTLTLTVNYKNENNTGTTETFNIGLPVKGSIFIDIIKIEPNYEKNVVKIEIANKGTADAKSIEAKLIVNGKTVGVDYVTQLKANKKSTLEFPLILRGQGKLVLNYIGLGTEENEITKELTFNFTQPQQDNTVNIIIAVVIISAVVYIFWKRFKKK